MKLNRFVAFDDDEMKITEKKHHELQARIRRLLSINQCEFIEGDFLF
jgi:hypothetical protein